MGLDLHKCLCNFLISNYYRIFDEKEKEKHFLEVEMNSFSNNNNIILTGKIFFLYLF